MSARMGGERLIVGEARVIRVMEERIRGRCRIVLCRKKGRGRRRIGRR